MKKTWIALTCSGVLLSGCQMITETESVTKTQYSGLWTSAEVAADNSVQTATPEMVNPDTDPNRILISKTDSGNREYLFADSIRQENGTVVALIEYRYAQPQKLPSNGLTYTHNHWFEQIDCANSLRTIRTTTHYNAQGEIVDANEYPIPKLTPAQMKLLAQPNDGVIKEVCQRVGMNAGKVATLPPVVTKPQKVTPPPVAASEPVVPPAAPPTPTQPETASEPAVSNKTDDTSPPADTPSTQNNKKTTDKSKKGKNKKDAKKENDVSVKSEIDFIGKDKTEPAAPAKQPETPEKEQPAKEKEVNGATLSAEPDNVNDDLPPDFWEIGAPTQQ